MTSSQSFPAEPVIAVGGQHPNRVVFNSHDRDVESAATQIEHENCLILIELVETVG